MKQRVIGDTSVSAIGLGGMPMLIDTADAYHLAAHDEVGHNEELIAKAIREYHGDTSDVLVATKGGHLRPEAGAWAQNGHPEYLKEAAKASAQRLGVEAIGLYQFHRPDPAVPYADSVGALAELLDAGVIRMAGISNATVDQIREANEVLGGRLASVQNRFSPVFRSSEDELALCDEMGIAFLPWSPLGGIGGAADLGTTAEDFAIVARERDVSPQVIALAWELAKSDVVIPIPGASRPQSILDSVTAATIKLRTEDMDRLDASRPTEAA
jgi:aryl-alcohol dehydrogenase-like predicted oxidoreductase